MLNSEINYWLILLARFDVIVHFFQNLLSLGYIILDKFENIVLISKCSQVSIFP